MRLKRLTIMTAMILVTIGLSLTLFFPTLVFAQDGNGGLDISWGVIIAGLISGALVPLAVQLLTWSWPRAPTWLKALAGPVLAPVLALSALFLSNALGFPIDLTEAQHGQRASHRSSDQPVAHVLVSLFSLL
ncbi:hypothetical protein LCGC14_1912570, partial [marine sediment metagenome]